MFRRLLPVALLGVLAACGGTTTETPAAQSNAAGSTGTTLAAVAETPASTASPASSEVNATDPPGAVPIEVPTALQFTAPLLGGGDIEMATLAGRPVLLWFWAPW